MPSPSARYSILPAMKSESMKTNKAFKKILKNIGEALAELRIKKGYSTIKEFVQKHDLPQIHDWRIEKGKTNVTLKSLNTILSIHNMSLQELFHLVMEEEQIA